MAYMEEPWNILVVQSILERELICKYVGTCVIIIVYSLAPKLII